MMEIGRVCVKTAGRDSRGYCVIIDVIDDNYVMIDGQTRRRKCNVKHLEPTDKKVEIAKQGDHEKVVEELQKLELGIKFEDKKSSKEKKEKKERPKKQKKKKNLNDKVTGKEKKEEPKKDSKKSDKKLDKDNKNNKDQKES